MNREIVSVVQGANIEDLITGAEQLLSASDAQFEQIRGETWFTRLFDVITFSHKTEKRLGENICTLSQAQNILLQILPRFAEQNTQVAKLIQDQADTINRLSKNDLQLVQLYKSLQESLQNRRLGIQKASELESLPDSDKVALSACLQELAIQYSEPSEAQKDYFNEIHRILDCEGQGKLQHDMLGSLPESSRKQLLQCCLEYAFLADANFDHFSPELQNFIDCFNLGKKSIDEAKTFVSEMFHARGAGGIIEKYRQKADNLIPAEFEIEFGDVIEAGLDNEEESVDIPDISEFEEITLDGIIHIFADEVRSYKYKIIHFMGIINCEGTLNFDTCILHYGETADETIEIGLAKTASLSMRRCTIENHSYDENNFFIRAECLEQTIELIGCEFVNCCYFLTCDGGLMIEQCRIINPGDQFIYQTCSEEVEIEISECEFQFAQRPDFFPEDRHENIIRSWGTMDFSSCLVKGNLEICSAKDAASIARTYSSFLYCDGKYINIEYSTFQGISDVCKGHCGFVSSSVFEHCAYIFSFPSGSDGADITDCRFNHCTSIADDLAPSSEILDSQFNYCYNNLITSSFHGGLIIRYCEFNNIEVGDLCNVLCFESSRKEFTHSTVDLCRFNGVAIHSGFPSGVEGVVLAMQDATGNGVPLGAGFLIVGDVSAKVSDYVVEVSKCTFLNCSTERNSGKIIREYDRYYGHFNARKEAHSVCIADCKGLDKVNQGSEQSENIIIKAKDKKGLTIGLNIAGGIIAGIPGVIASNAINKMLKDDDIHAE